MTQNSAPLNPGIAAEARRMPGGRAAHVGSCPPVPLSRSDWILVSLPALAAAAIYGPTVVSLIEIWRSDPNYSHGFLVPVCSAAFAALAWRRHGSFVHAAAAADASLWAGVGKTLLGLALHGLAVLFGNVLLDVLSIIVVLRGVVLTVGGRKAHGEFGFAALFLIFMAPLPTAWYQPMAVMLQQFISFVSSEVLGVFGATVHREGYRVFLPGCTMHVGEACSGIRGLVAVIALAVALGHFLGRAAWYRWTLALLAIPIATVANCLRVVLTGVIVMAFGNRWGEGVYHVLEGLVVGGGSVAALLVVAMKLARHQPEEAPLERPQRGPLARRRLAAGCLVLMLGLAGSEVWRGHLEAAGSMPSVPLNRPLNELPLTLDDWRGVDERIGDGPVADGAQGSGYQQLQRTYARVGQQPTAKVWVVYAQDGSDRGHHPEVCMRAAGKFEDPSARQLLAVEGHPAAVQQYRFGALGARQCVFYWHYSFPAPQGARPDLVQRIYQSARRRPASVTLEVFVRESSPEDVQAGQQLVRLLDRAIQAHLGPGAVRGNSRQPIDG